MEGLTDFITQYRWEDIFTVWFVVIDNAHQALQEYFGEWRKRGTPPEFSDAEVITVALIADTFFAGREDKTLSFIREYVSTTRICFLNSFRVVASTAVGVL
jgi:hypothetical protein